MPGGGGTQYPASRVGRNRAPEAVLSADLYDAKTAERYGWVNRAVPADELDEVVDRLARNIAALPDGMIAAAKRAILPEDLAEGFLRENDAWMGQIMRPAVTGLIRDGLVHGTQSTDGERDLEGLLRRLTRQDPDEGPYRKRLRAALGGDRLINGGRSPASCVGTSS